MKILFIFTGIYIGAVSDEWSGAIFGFFIGWIAGALVQQQKTLKKLEAQFKLIQSNPTLLIVALILDQLYLKLKKMLGKPRQRCRKHLILLTRLSTG